MIILLIIFAIPLWIALGLAGMFTCHWAFGDGVPHEITVADLVVSIFGPVVFIVALLIFIVEYSDTPVYKFKKK